jgi:metal-dependent hydrolase (beta-lactamase superfamily II)
VVATIFRRMIRVVLFVASVVPAVAQGQEIKVTLLGTGCPPPVMHRFGPSTLVEAGEQKLLFDAGRGALQRLTQLKVRWQDVQGVFLTHLHSDHVVGFPDSVVNRVAGGATTQCAAPGVGSTRDQKNDVPPRTSVRVRHPNPAV